MDNSVQYCTVSTVYRTYILEDYKVDVFSPFPRAQIKLPQQRRPGVVARASAAGAGVGRVLDDARRGFVLGAARRGTRLRSDLRAVSISSPRTKGRLRREGTRKAPICVYNT